MPRSIVFPKIRVILLFYCNFAQVVLLSRTKRHINRSATACFMLLFPQKIPLDFTCQIRYNKRRSQMICRCVGMADEGDSKSLVLITRVGSTPTTGIKREPPPARLAGVLFLSAACERVEQHGPAPQGERSALRAVAQCAGDPHHRSPSLSGGVSFFICGV